MRKTHIFASLILMVIICAFATGCINDSPPALKFADASQVDLLVFRCGDVLLTHEKDNLDWLAAYGEVPADISLVDGEFAYVNADIARVTGGNAFYTGNPQFKKVNSIQRISLDDLVNNEELTVYDPSKQPFRGLGYYDSDTGRYCIACHLGTFYVYENGVCTGFYHTKDDMVSALGIN